MGYDIFVSYSTQDKLFADALVNNLEHAKVRCWYAPRDIPAGTPWPSAITAAIKQTPIMLLIFSSSANSSEEVSRELTLASNNSCLVIPVRIENVVPSEKLEYHLINRHWLDVYDLDLEVAIREIMEVVLSHEALFGTRELEPEDAEIAEEPLQARQPASKGQLQRSIDRRKYLKKLAPVLALLILGAGLYSFLGPEKKIKVRAAPNAQVYYYEGQKGVHVKTLLVEPRDPDSLPEHLVQISGLEDSRYNGKVFLCKQFDQNGDLYFQARIGKQNRNIFMVRFGDGIVWEPESENAYLVAFVEQRRTAASINRFLDEWHNQ